MMSLAGEGANAREGTRIGLWGAAQAIAFGQSLNEGEHMATVHAAQHLPHIRFLKLATAKGNGLIGQRKSITHTASMSSFLLRTNCSSFSCDN